MLSTLTGDNKYGDAALRAALALFERKGSQALVGKHINIQSGIWLETASGIGSNADSFYEYLFKASQLFRSDGLFTRFSEVFIAVKKHLQIGDWFSELDLSNGKYRRTRFESLQAFWPGMESNMGFTESSARLLNTFYAIWSDYGFLPEDTDWVHIKIFRYAFITHFYFQVFNSLFSQKCIRHRQIFRRTILCDRSL